jgi:NADH:ubiquinone oxidoreductase subunit 3 (subunit A)
LAFLAGAIALPFLVGSFGIEMSSLLLALIGGSIGLIMVAVAFDWGLIFITAWAGASAVTFGLQQRITLDGTLGTVIFLVLMVVGIFWQASRRRKG